MGHFYQNIKQRKETPNYYSDTAVVIVNGDCNKLQLKGFEKLWGEDYSDIDLSAGDRTPTHDSILNIDEVFSILQDDRNGSNNKKSLSVQVVYDTN